MSDFLQDLRFTLRTLVKQPAFGFTVLAMLALGIVFFVDYLDDTLKTPDDLVRTLGLVPLVALLAGLAIFPLVFANGLDPAGIVEIRDLLKAQA